SVRTASFKRVFESHALGHHKHYAVIFSDEPVAPGEDREIRLTVRKAPIKALPFAALIALVSWLGAAVFVAVMIFHHWAWNKIHLEMHKPEQRIFSTGPVYKFLARQACGPTRLIENIFSNGDCERHVASRFTVWPVSDVPPPRGSSATFCSRATLTAARASSG